MKGFVLFLLSALSFSTAAATAEPRYDNLVEIKRVDPSILVELRYATARNTIRRAIYPPDTPALVRPGTAQRLLKAQAYLRARGYGLKIWDAYRPLAAQVQLWQRTQDGNFVANPRDGDGSLHTWGVAVDATLVDARGHEVAMPSDFDEFKPEARLHYDGGDPVVRANLKLLQRAMRHGGFYGTRSEWWHFVAYDWKKYAPIREAKRLE